MNNVKLRIYKMMLCVLRKVAQHIWNYADKATEVPSEKFQYGTNCWYIGRHCDDIIGGIVGVTKAINEIIKINKSK